MYTVEQFWSTVEKGDGCWEWQGHLSTNGYGRLPFGGRMQGAHRISWQLERGPIPDGLCVLHHCDNRRCVRPNHLFLGTYQDNARDMAAKGRAHLQRRPDAFAGDRHWTRRHPELRLQGERNPAARLVAAQVVEIRERFAAGATYRALAKAYGVSTGTISFIVSGRHWPHVGGPIGLRAPKENRQ
jgi:hypothetical protein